MTIQDKKEKISKMLEIYKKITVNEVLLNKTSEAELHDLIKVLELLNHEKVFEFNTSSKKKALLSVQAFINENKKH